MQSSNNSFIDYFKLFKVFELKKIEKTGLVKIVQDKILNRKVVSVEGNISTSNFITLSTHNFPNIPFSQRYLYIQGFIDAGKSFCFQVAYTLGNKSFKAVYSTLYKTAKKHAENTMHLPLNLPPSKWTLGVIDLYQLGLHFGFTNEQMKIILKVNSVEIRASSKMKGVFQSDYLYSVDKMPKQMMFPLQKQQNFFEKYHYFLESTDPTSLKQVENKSTQFLTKKQQNQNIKDKKSIDKIKNQLPTSKSRKSIDKTSIKQKQQPKTKENNIKRQNHLPPQPNRTKKQDKPSKSQREQEQIENEIQQQQIEPPKPQPVLSLGLQCVQGFTINNGNLMCVQSYLCKPAYIPTHKPIQILASCDQSNIRVVTGYNDGSVCLWDTVRKSPHGYFMTELSQLKIILNDSRLNLILIGLDKLKRQVINIISDNSVVFRQISNFNILGAVLIDFKTFEFGFITYGFENIRLWRINNQKQIIQGVNIYLGQTNRKVKYTSATVIPTKQDYLAYVTDNNGFITTISITESKMIQSIKLDNCCIDKILLLYDGRAIISNEQGIIKIIGLERMQVQEEYSLNNRIKDIRQLQSQQIVMTHYNKSIGLLNLSTSMYSFTMRSHTSTITKLAYSPPLNKVISISKDNSIRIWQYVADDGVFHYRLQQQYQFIITGEDMVDISCAVQGKLEDINKVVVGGDSGKLRSINIEKYCIQQQVIIEKGSMNFNISRNGKYIICTYQSGNSYLLDSNFTIVYKYLHDDNSKKKMKVWKNGFNRINKEYFIQNIQDQSLQFYALKQQNVPIFSIKYDVKTSAEINFIGSRVFILNDGELKLFQKGTMMQILNLSQKVYTNIGGCICFDFPIIAFGVGQKIIVKVMNTKLQESIQLPQPLNNISLSFNSQKGEGFLVGSGIKSYSLYVFSLKVHNLQKQVDELVIQPEIIQKDYNSQLQISFSNKTTVSAYRNIQQANSHHLEQEVPKQLKKLYAQEQQLYQEVKQYLFPKQFQNIPKNQSQHQQQQQEQAQIQSKQLSVKLSYGYQLKQIAKADNQIGGFNWISDNNSLILLTGCGKSIMQHFFTVPIKHKILHFPSQITSMCMSPKSYEGLRYLCVCINGLIKMYNIYEEISFIRNIDAISSTFKGSVIFQSGITNCNRYVLTLSYDNIHFDNKIYIHLIEISSGNVVSSSYLGLPMPKNKYKENKPKDAKDYTMLINPFKTSLQFVIFDTKGLLYFYRVTSIFTLQMMQLEELAALSRDKITSISCGCFISIGEANFQDAVLAIGSQNGSLVFIDCRTASIMIACVSLLNTPILGISYSKSHDEQHQKLILFSNSTFLTVFNLTQGLNSILASMQEKVKPQSSIKRIMTLDGEVTSRSNIESNSQQIVITKSGSLWLLDYEDFLTVKVSSVHTQQINKAQVIMGKNKQAYLLTCADDGCVKLSNLMNLQQVFEIYKPRKTVKSFNIQGNLTLIAFNDEIYIYNKIEIENVQQQSSITSLGSFKLDANVIGIEHIPSTENYYILTQKEVLIIYVGFRAFKTTKKSDIKSMQIIVQIKKITDVQNPFSLIVNDIYAPYDQFALVCRPGKIMTWMRKCLKRNYNPIDELSNVHELTYYLVDVNSKNTVDHSFVKFISNNEYIWGSKEQGVIKIRNIKEHSIMREISIAESNISTINFVCNSQLLFIIGDQYGYVSILNENGLMIERTKALQCKVSGICLWQENKILAYGSKYVAIFNPISFR